MNRKLPLLEELINYHKENNLIYSMPGNKAGKAFERDEIGKYFAENLGYLDITEVEPLDNLHHPEGIIKEAQEKLAKLYNVKKAYFLVNGTTGGNLAAVFSAFNEGDEIIVERNCHRSIYNAIIMRKLKVRWIKGSSTCLLKENSGVFLPPDEESIMKAVERFKKAKGIILTYPNYFGIGYDLESVIKKLKKNNLKVIIDEAHGAHYGVMPSLPKNAAPLADITITSAHKTLPALTGGSYLLSNMEGDSLDFYVSAFMTTSPSYLIMASLDYARFYLESYGEEDYKKLIKTAEDMKGKIESLNKVKILKKEDLPTGYNIDLSRYVLLLPKGYSGVKLQDYLREENIQCEMCFHDGVVLILSYYESEKSLEALYCALKKMDLEVLKDEDISFKYPERIPEKELEPFEVFSCSDEYIDFRESLGRIVKEAIVPYPPGIPIACPGEKVDKELIDEIEAYIRGDITILGMKDSYMKVCKIEL